MKVDVRDLDIYYQEDEFDGVFVKKEKNKKKQVPNEFKRQNNKKLNKPRRYSNKDY